MAPVGTGEAARVMISRHERLSYGSARASPLRRRRRPRTRGLLSQRPTQTITLGYLHRRRRCAPSATASLRHMTALREL